MQSPYTAIVRLGRAPALRSPGMATDINLFAYPLGGLHGGWHGGWRDTDGPPCAPSEPCSTIAESATRRTAKIITSALPPFDARSLSVDSTPTYEAYIDFKPARSLQGAPPVSIYVAGVLGEAHIANTTPRPGGGWRCTFRVVCAAYGCAQAAAAELFHRQQEAAFASWPPNTTNTRNATPTQVQDLNYLWTPTVREFSIVFHTDNVSRTLRVPISRPSPEPMLACANLT